MITNEMRKRAYSRIDREAARRAAVATAFIYNCAEWGEPEYIAMTAEKRYRSFGFGSNPVIEVSSFAFAQALAAALNAGKLPALHADYSARREVAFVRSEVARRNFLLGRIDRFTVRMRRAIRAAHNARPGSARQAALHRCRTGYRTITDARRTLADVHLKAPFVVLAQGLPV